MQQQPQQPIDINLVMDEYQARLSEVEKQRILNTALVKQLQAKVKELDSKIEELTQENEKLKKPDKK